MKFDEHIPMLERGGAFPQHYGNAIPFGDRYSWWNPADWSYRFWSASLWESAYPNQGMDERTELFMMGGEL